MFDSVTNLSAYSIGQSDYENLIRQYIESTDDQVLESIYSNFYFAFQQLQCCYQPQIVTLIYSYLSKIKETTNATYIYNILTFAYQFIIDYESLIDLTLVGPQRHKNRNNFIYFSDEKMKSFIKIFVQERDQVFPFYVRQDNFISNIALALGTFYNTECENVFLYYKNQLINHNDLVGQYNFKSEDNLKAVIQKTKTFDYSNLFLSLIINNDEYLFYYILMIIKEDKHYSFCTPDQFKKITKIAWKLLKVIPTYPQLLKDFTNTDYAIEAFNNEKSELYRRYILQIMCKKYQDNPNKIEIGKFALESILQKKFSENELRDAFQIVIFYLQKSNKTNVEQNLIYVICSIVVDSKNPRVSQSALNLFIEIKRKSETEKFILKQQGFLIEIMRKAVCDVEPFFRSFRMHTELFDILKGLVNDFSTNPPMLKRLFRVLKNLINSSCDTKEAFKFVLDNMKKVPADILIEYLEFFWRCLEVQPQLLSMTTKTIAESLSVIDYLFNFITNISTNNDDDFQFNLEDYKLYEKQLRNVSIKIFIILCKNDDSVKKGILKKMEVMSTVMCNHWNYSPETFKRNSNGYCGLRNLGSTCYMNSIFQQLYFNSEFRKSLLSYQKEDDLIHQIRNIFIKLALSNQASVDTNPFATVWKSKDQQFSVRYQEDANEFFHKILGELPSEVTSTFIGKQTRKFEGTKVQFNKVINELFNTIQIQVNGYSSFDESLPEAFKPQILTGNDYRDEKLGNIDVRMTVEVESLPKTIVFLLERFDYNKQTSRRVKITNEFSFPSSFNADKYFPGQSGQYYLTGVITHSGTIDTGHYTSLIRHGDIWISFDDMESHNISNEDYNDCVRGNKNLENARCAYMLFYETRIVENSNPNPSASIRQYLLPEEIDKITKENNNFSITQAAFDQSTAEFALNSNDLLFTIHYFINVLCHSYMKSLSTSFSNKILKYINEKPSNAQIITSYFKETQELIFEITRFAPSEFNDSILDILSQLFQKVDYLAPFPIVDFIVKNLKDSISVWRTLPILAKIIYYYIKIDEDHVRIGSQNLWGNQILNYIETFYVSSLNTYALNNIDFSYLFKSLEILFPSMDSKLMKNFVTNYGERIEKSRENSYAFLSLKDMIYGVKQAQSAASNPREFCSYIITLNESELITQSIEKCNKPKSWILDALISNHQIVKQTLLKFKSQVLFPLLTDSDFAIREKTEELIHIMFNELPKLENYQNAELLYYGRSYVNVFDRSMGEKSNKNHILDEISALKKQKKMSSTYKLICKIKKKYKMKDSVVFYINKEANELLDSALEFIGPNCSVLINQLSNMLRIIHWLKVRLNNDNISNLKEILNLIGNQRTNPNIDLIELFHLYQTFTEEQFDSFFKESNVLLMHSLCPNFENVILQDRIARFIMFISLISSNEQYIMCFRSDYFFPAYSFLIECSLPQPFCYMISKFCSLLSHSNLKRKKKKIKEQIDDDDDDFDYSIDHKQLSNPVEIDPNAVNYDDNDDDDDDVQNRIEEEDNDDKDVNDDNDNEIDDLIITYNKHDDDDDELNKDDELTQDDLSLILNFAEFIGNHAVYSFFTPQTRDKEAVFIRVLNKIKIFFTPELTSLYINQYFMVYDYFCTHPNLNDFTNLILSLPNSNQYSVNKEMADEIVTKNFKRIFLEKRDFNKLLINLVSASTELADAFAKEFELFVSLNGQYKIEGDVKNIKKKMIEDQRVWSLAEVYMYCALKGLKGERMLFITCHFFESTVNSASCAKFAKSKEGKNCIRIITSIMKQNDPNINQDDFFNATIEIFGFLTGNRIPIDIEVEDFLITYLDNLEIFDLDVEPLAESINASSPGYEYSLKLLSVYFKAKEGMKKYFLENFPINREVIERWPPSLNEYRNMFSI